MMADSKYQFEHILWMGGSPCAGKTSIADLLADQYRLVVYHADEMFDEHQRRVTRTQQPYLYKWTHTPWNDLWMQSKEKLLEEAVECYSEQFEMIVRDLNKRSSKERILVEGNSLLPDRVAELLSKKEGGIWVVPTESFQRERYRARGQWVEEILAECDDPEGAYRNWMERDAAFGQWINERARELNLEVIEVSGQRTLEVNAEIIARHFGLI
jgi:2-phosphoglycerate kinase